MSNLAKISQITLAKEDKANTLDFTASSVSNNIYGIDIVDDSGDVLRVNKDGSTTYIPVFKPMEETINAKVFNTMLKFNMSPHIVSSMVPLARITEEQIIKINDLGGIKILDKSSFQIGEGGSIISRDFIEDFNRNMTNLSKDIVETPVKVNRLNETSTILDSTKTASDDKKGLSFKYNKSVISIIVSYNTYMRIKESETIIATAKESGLDIIDKETIAIILSDTRVLKDVAKEIGISYSSMSTIRPSILSSFSSSYGNIVYRVPGSGVGVFEKFNNSGALPTKENSKAIKDLISSVINRSDVSISIASIR